MDEGLLRNARAASERWDRAQVAADVARDEYHHAVRLLHLGGASMREIADALQVSHQRVHQMIDGTAEGWKPGRRTTGEPVCSFCDRPATGDERIIAGPGVLVCEACLPPIRECLTSDVPVYSGHTLLIPMAGNPCSFCAATTRVVGAGRVRICEGCVVLCEEITTAGAS